LIGLYFFLSNLYTLISMVWFILAEELKSKKLVPKLVVSLVNHNRKKETRKEASTEEVAELLTTKDVNVALIINYMNYGAFIFMFLFMIISHLCIWLIISA